MARKEDKIENHGKTRIFSKREGKIICPDGTIVEFEKVLLVAKETAEWLFKSFPDIILKVD